MEQNQGPGNKNDHAYNVDTHYIILLSLVAVKGFS